MGRRRIRGSFTQSPDCVDSEIRVLEPLFPPVATSPGVFRVQYLGPRQDPQEVEFQAAAYGWTEYPRSYSPIGGHPMHGSWNPLLLFLLLILILHLWFPDFGAQRTESKTKKQK